MDDDQQFCLRWNNHQSTLVAVFDTLLENGTLVDCTLAAEGKCLNAHKVVLSACSPYFEALLSKHFDKHPILILKDVKFQELKAMMDYMYRGEVNISQDQLGALLKAAESLQIKGLSDNRKGETERKPAPAPPPPKSPQPASTLPKVQGLTIEQRARDDSREGSISPGPRKKKRLRRKSEELDNHDASNSSESHSLPAQNIPTLPAVTKMNADVPEQVETKSEILTRHKQTDEMPQVPIIKEKIETHTELMLEPKSEYVDEMNEDSIEDLTLDDDDLSNMEQMDDGAGPSHGNTGEGSSQGFGGWHMGNQSQDEVFLAAQEAVGAHRDSQDNFDEYMLPFYPTINMSRIFKTKRNLKSKAKKSSPEKTSPEKPTSSATATQQSVTNATVIPHFVTRHVTRKGDIVEIIRCSKCAGFLSKNANECKGCLTKEKGGSTKQKRNKLLLHQRKSTNQRGFASPKSKQIKVNAKKVTNSTQGEANKSNVSKGKKKIAPKENPDNKTAASVDPVKKAVGVRRSRVNSTAEKSVLTGSNKIPAKKRSRSAPAKRKRNSDGIIGEIIKSEPSQSDLVLNLELTRLDDATVSKYLHLPEADNTVGAEYDFVDVESVDVAACEDFQSLYDSLDDLVNNTSNRDDEAANNGDNEV